jgi:Type II restriction endonuclease EcoO109I
VSSEERERKRGTRIGALTVPPLSTQAAALVPEIATTLGVSTSTAQQIVAAFERHVAEPLRQNLERHDAYTLAKRNPMIYTARGATTVDEWVERRLEDWETSAIEGHLGTWQEEVARIISGGIKPGSGVDLQLARSGIDELYAIQSAPNTKSAGGRRADVDALRAGAAALRASKRTVETYIAVLSGQRKSRPLKKDPNVMVLASDDFWQRVSGIAGFRPRLIHATAILSGLIAARAATEVERIRAEAQVVFGDSDGNLELVKLANPPPKPRRRR